MLGVFRVLALDSLRMLRGQRMFWLVLGVSVLVGLLYASVGFSGNGYSVGFGAWEVEHGTLRAGTEEAEAFHVLLFTNFVVKWWLGLGAIFLALLSCGGSSRSSCGRGRWTWPFPSRCRGGFSSSRNT